MALQSLRLFVYCDESGNAGPNLLDPGQPVYVLAGWAIAEHRVDTVTDALARYVSNLALQAPELHGRKFLRTQKGQRELTTLLRLMGQAGALPVYSISERLYWIAGKIVETFLDSEYNPLSPRTFYYDCDKKQELADDICTLPPHYLRQFAEGYMAHDRNGLAASARSLSRVYLLKGDRTLSSMFLGCLPSLDRIVADEHAAHSTHALGTVNVPTLVTFLSTLDKMGRAGGLRSIHVVHDESKEFATAYQAIHQRYKDGTLGIQLFHPDESRGVFQLEKVLSLHMVDSRSSALIQAADILAAALQAYAAACARRQAPQAWLTEALAPTVALCLPSDGPPLGHLLGSPPFLRGFLSCLIPRDTPPP